ncbi:proteoglycan 4 isoform X2 [Tribolium castaneum]|nr:PREDICTED: proteoglycan 4 isoform X2 [Tribolium castaneum]|eukprot:XP_001816051.2 PREDICTED: proteoglycan 4 isoform X2 [Tribolium castaneum]
MRIPLRRNKRTLKILRMKQVPVKNKKQSESKSEKDYISETISFVIKGKLTPIKPSFVAKRGKKPPKKKEITDGKQKPIMRKAKKVSESTKTGPKVQTKTAKKPTSVPKIIKKSDTNTSLIQDSTKKDIKSENISASKKAAKETKPLKKVKTEIADVKKKSKKAITKRVKSPQKTEPIDSEENQKAEDIKTKQTIEKLLKQANKALKQPQLKSKSTLQKSKKASKSTKKAPVPGKKPKVAKQSIKQEPTEIKKQVKRKTPSDSQEDTSTSDELTLNELCPAIKTESEQPKSKKLKIKSEPVSDSEKKSRKPVLKHPPKKIPPKTNLVLMKKRVMSAVKDKVKRKENQRSRKMKLFGFWNGPKRHRVASLNALAKVHCLYENETRSNLLDPIEVDKKEPVEEKKSSDDETVPCTRTLRSVPGLRAVGKHWDMHDTTSSSEDNSGYESTYDEKPKPKVKKELVKKAESSKKPEPKRRRNRTELIMDLKDMVVRKRMASLNASAILAASYSVERRASKSPKSDSETDSSDYFITDNEEEADKKCFEAKVKKEEDGKLIEVRATPNKKVAVILNQDTDVTITGVYVNSTTRSTHHEGYCSIAGMQYRISATSHTQTAATAVATETLLQSSSSSTQENSNSESLTSCKSYTPLDALSNMQPPPGPGIQHPHQHMGPPQHVLPLPQHQLSPSRRHGCPSAFSTPHPAPYPPHHPPPIPGDPGYVHGYYQPAGPLISVPHGHTQQQPPPPIAKLSESSPTSASPIHQPPPAPSSNGDSSDSEVIITSVTAGKETVPPPQQPPTSYRYSQYPGTPPGYPYSYPPHYYPTPPPAPSYAHHDLCYSTTPYLHHKYPPTTYRRFLPSTQYYAPNPPDIYATPPTGPSQQNQQVVTATPVSASSSSYQPSPSGPPPAIMEPYPPPPPPTLVETYPHPPHYYPSYGPAPPSCYTHPPATRTLPYLNATYQSCPCPMQSCPKNVLTGPLTGDSKRSNISSIAKDSMPLPPVALALPLEPASATGPPSPARGSAGMPPPPSPAGATYQPPPPAPKQEEATECTPVEKKRKARVGKAMVRNNIAAIQQNTAMLLMCNPNQRSFPGEVKREIESPKEKETEAKKEICSDEDVKTPKIILQTPVEPEIKNIERIPEPQNLKKEENVEEKEEGKVEEKKVLKEELPPCVNTVAENVKVKNMKRKISTSKKAEEENEISAKKVKLEPKYPNGSYKDLIKKDMNTVKINNGKRKLITENDDGTKKTKTKTKKQTTKRKLSSAKEEDSTPTKRLKQTKPLTASNQQNSKHYSKEKDKNKTEPVLIENKEPQKKSAKKLPVNSKANKKLAPAILDSLIAKNNIDRTIDSVISESSVRTNTSALKTVDKCAKTKEPVLNNKKSTNKNGQIKSKTVECRKSVVTRRKSKCKEVPQAITRVPRRSLQMPRWSNGWTWEGEPFETKVFLNSDETTVVRKCYPAMRHEEGDIIEVRDCVLLKAGPRKNDLPFVAKIAYLWENPEDGEMMMSLLWYYRPEHTEQGRTPADQPDEVFASRHKDSNSVACIDDKCYVLTFHEYCRYRKDLRRLEEGIEETSPCIPTPEPYPRCNRQPPSPIQVSSDMVFFCRRVYDFRQKRIVKNPS